MIWGSSAKGPATRKSFSVRKRPYLNSGCESRSSRRPARRVSLLLPSRPPTLGFTVGTDRSARTTPFYSSNFTSERML